ncbi:MAG: hypothetical protein HY913_00310 [Desulfomonile tiedjei]|nr:hypothetical protein [Desulfomonile tiedjei]
MAIKGETMRAICCIAAVILVACFALYDSSDAWAAADYDSRFVRNYPPGNYGMWYKAQRFSENTDPEVPRQETYRWDRFMSRVTEVAFPFYPIPYDWEYGTDREFNLPDYNRNDWWR